MAFSLARVSSFSIYSAGQVLTAHLAALGLFALEAALVSTKLELLALGSSDVITRSTPSTSNADKRNTSSNWNFSR
jgi:hypothetical protein